MFDPSDPSQPVAPAANGATATLPPSTPPLEALLFGAGMISADQLGDLVRDAAISQQPVASVALERGLVTAPMLRTLLEQAGVEPSTVPGIPAETAYEMPIEPVTFEAAPAVEEPAASPIAAVEQPAVVPAPAPDVTAAVAAAVAAAAPDVGVIVPMPNGHALQTPSPEEPALRLAADVAEPAVAEAPTPSEDEQLEQFLVLVRLEGGERVLAGAATGFEAAAASARTLAGLFAEGGDWPLVGGRYVRPQGVVSVDIERVPSA